MGKLCSPVPLSLASLSELVRFLIIPAYWKHQIVTNLCLSVPGNEEG